MSGPINIVGRNENGSISSMSVTSIGRIPVETYWQDQTTTPLQLAFSRSLGSAVKLTANNSVDDKTITVASTTNFVVGGQVTLISEKERFYSATVLSKTATILTVDTPLDYAFQIDDEALPESIDMDVDGSTTPVTFSIRGATGSIDVPVTIDITRLLGVVVTATAPELSDFGDITSGLTNGLVLRRNNGTINNIHNLHCNCDLARKADHITEFGGTFFFDAADGLFWAMTFAGQENHGVAIRLAPDESLEYIVQDNLTALTQLRIVAEGHIVE